jgi:site-specific DNA recombinase
MIAAIYARKSNDQNLPDADKSVSRQVEHATAFAQSKGWTVDPAHVYVDDAISGAEFVRRPGLAALVAALFPRPPFQVLVMAEQFRLGREQIETAYTLKRIIDAGVRVWYYLDDREARLDNALAKVMTALTNFAGETERESARARTYDAMLRKAKAGYVAGGITYGYTNVRVEGHVERRIHEVEAAVVRRLFELYAAGVGLRAIARTLTAEGAPPPMPRQRDRVPGWGPVALREILRRELYRGEVVWNRRQKADRGGRTKVRIRRPEADLVRVTDERLRVVSDELWEAVQVRRAARAATKPAGCWTRSRTATRPALLAGLARCARCGSGLVRLTRAHGGPETRRHVHMYGCGRVTRGLPCENRVALAEGPVDQAVLEALAKALSADAIEAAVKAALQDARTTLAGSAARRTELAREATVLEERIGRLTEHLAAGTAVAAPLLAKLAEEEARRVALARERDALEVAGRTIDLTSATVLRAIRREAENIRGALLEHRDEAREVLAAFISSMRFEPFGRGRDRGFEFHGAGDYGPLLGATSARVGDPSGTRTPV